MGRDQRDLVLGGNILDFIADGELASVTVNNLKSAVTCHLAFAKYALEAAHFQKDLPEHKRIALEGMARSYQSAGMALQQMSPDKPTAEMYEDAWDALEKYCEKFGYRSNAYSELRKVKEYNFFQL